jgi:hypothetical protein
MEQGKKCARPGCNCQVSQGGQYCSKYCEGKETKAEQNCGCGHAGCSSAK